MWDEQRAEINDNQQWLTSSQCGERFGFSAKHWGRLVDGGKAPQPVRFGRLVRWKLKTLEAWEEAGCPPCDPCVRFHRSA